MALSVCNKFIEAHQTTDEIQIKKQKQIRNTEKT